MEIDTGHTGLDEDGEIAYSDLNDEFGNVSVSDEEDEI